MPWKTDLEEVRRVYAAEPGKRPLVAYSRAFDPALLPVPLVALETVPDDPGEIHFDVHDRPVRATSGVVEFAWEWREDGSVLERAQTLLGPRVTLVRRESVVSVDMLGRSAVQRVTWDGDVAVRADEALRWEGGSSRGADCARVAVVEGAVVTAVRHASAEAEGDVEAGLARGAALAPVDVVWTRLEERPSVPTDVDVEALARARALDGALRAAVAESGIDKPFLLLAGHEYDDPPLPPKGWLAGAAWRDHVRRTNPDDGAAARGLRDGVARGLVAELDIADRLDADALGACRALAVTHPAAWDLRSKVQERLASLLNAGLPFFAAVATDYDDDALRQTFKGGADVAALTASVTSLAAPDAVGVALRDRGALEALIRESGLDAHAHRLAHEVALDGFVLVPGDGRSHLGGPALLPPGEAWPEGHTFLGAIDRAEVGLGTGWLLFFADLEELTWDEVNAPGSPVRLFATDAPVPADGPALAPRPVRFEPRLSLPGWHDADEELGFDDAESEAWFELRQRLIDDDHHFGGYASGVQGERPPDGTVLLLHLEWDEELGFEYGDGGTLQFRIPEAALAAEDWSRVIALADSS